MRNYKNYIYLILLSVILASCSNSAGVVNRNAGQVDFGAGIVTNAELLAELNFARTQPQQYAKVLEALLPFYKGRFFHIPGQTPIKTNEGIEPVKEAISYLKKLAPREPLTFSNGLSLAAKDYVNIQGPTGKIGHYGPDGSSPTTRIQKYGMPVKTWGENIAYGPRTARDIVSQLIIDDGVKDRSHRILMYRPELKLVGFGYGPHTAYTSMCVMEFAVDFRENQQVAVYKK